TQAERGQTRLRQIAELAEASEAAERRKADAEKLRAERGELEARQREYASDMNLAQTALDVNNLGRARDLLARHRPRDGQSDLRGWEWRLLWKQCQSDELRVLVRQPDRITALALSS